MDMTEIKSNVKLIPSGPGYFLEVKDDLTEYRWALTKEELVLISVVIKDEVKKILEESE